MSNDDRESGRDGENGRDREEIRQFPFEGLHVYQRAQDAWTHARSTGADDPWAVAVEQEIREAALGIARATALSRSNGPGPNGAFGAQLEEARGALHAAAALLEQAARGGDPVDETLRGLLHDGSRMLGALVRSLGRDREGALEEEVAV